ncbi:alpha/beta hydrolase [Actinocatenispora sera]|uniref:DUF1023 domain-containing protein n=1 Tax=Actinocatenispora sera TaxID=390989 RepID=A0A810L9Z2_9ACTN|nr:alpha/beta hydrolase [Actinocatenispora sera]BCJ32109.1 hypothetical protein Asera_62170 [Actinocatenispora sera]
MSSPASPTAARIGTPAATAAPGGATALGSASVVPGSAGATMLGSASAAPGSAGATTLGPAGGTAFFTRPSALTRAAGTLADRAGTLSTMDTEVAATALPAGAFGGVPESAALHQRYAESLGTVRDRLRAGRQGLTGLADGLRGSATGYRAADTDAATGYRSLLAGESSGSASFDQLIAANRDKVAAALTSEQDTLATLRAAQRARSQESFFQRLFDGGHDLSDEIDSAQSRVDLYRSILDDNRKILDFDPAGNGRIVELIGDLDAGTHDVGVLVPGTFANLDNYSGLYERAKSFVDADPTGGLAMVTWQDGDFPPNLVDAASASWSQDLSPRLASFSHQLRGAIDSSAAAGNDVQVTVAGHSYGGAVVGLAEHDGLDADRVLSIESAGMGHDVWSPADLHDTRPDVQHYSMTAPGDPIGYVQGVQLGNLGHGADPDTFPGTVDLATGNYPDGTELHGVSAHSDVFTYHSDAWWNMYGVFTGGAVTTVTP